MATVRGAVCWVFGKANQVSVGTGDWCERNPITFWSGSWKDWSAERWKCAGGGS